MDAINDFNTNLISRIEFESTIYNYNPLFKKFTFNGVREILKECKIVSYNQLKTIYEQETIGNYIYIILYGKVLMKSNKNGILGILTSGECIGEEILFNVRYRYERSYC